MISEHPASLVIFALKFAALWLGMSVVLSAMSGWYLLQRLYPHVTEDQLNTPWFNPTWGGALSRRGWLRVSAGRSGLRLEALKIFAPLDRPVTIPWSEITARRIGGGNRVQLAFGTTGIFITVDAHACDAVAPLVPNWPGYSV